MFLVNKIINRSERRKQNQNQRKEKEKTKKRQRKDKARKRKMRSISSQELKNGEICLHNLNGLFANFTINYAFEMFGGD